MPPDNCQPCPRARSHLRCTPSPRLPLLFAHIDSAKGRLSRGHSFSVSFGTNEHCEAGLFSSGFGGSSQKNADQGELTSADA